VVKGGVEPPTFRFSGVADCLFGWSGPSVAACRCAPAAVVGRCCCCHRCCQSPL